MAHGDRPLEECKRAFLLDQSYSPTRKSILGFELFQGNYAEKWFRPNSPHRNIEAVTANRELVNGFVAAVGDWKADVGDPKRTADQIHLVTSASALEVLARLL